MAHYSTCEINLVGDHGFNLSSNSSLRRLVEEIRCQAHKLLGFVQRIIRYFNLSIFLKAPYLVRPTFEYGSVLWIPRNLGDSTMIEHSSEESLTICFSKSLVHLITTQLVSES